MNLEELQHNPILSSYVVQDLNENFVLPYKDNSYDMILLQLSIDYLTHPVEVLKQCCRLLKPHGIISISFSNRVFIDKAVAVWTGKGDIEHIETVGKYLHLAGFPDDSIQAQDLIGSKHKGDPLYVVSARK
jgi:ubiquinone/menaquinone biosynthesis C-methylase UbiE